MILSNKFALLALHHFRFSSLSVFLSLLPPPNRLFSGAQFTTCCGLEWLLNNPSKYSIARDSTCIYNKTTVSIEKMRGKPICPCVLSHARSSSQDFHRDSAQECRNSLGWVLQNGTCTNTSVCPPGYRLTPLTLGYVYNCTYPTFQSVSQCSSVPNISFYLGYDMSCECKQERRKREGGRRVL